MYLRLLFLTIVFLTSLSTIQTNSSVQHTNSNLNLFQDHPSDPPHCYYENGFMKYYKSFIPIDCTETPRKAIGILLKFDPDIARILGYSSSSDSFYFSYENSNYKYIYIPDSSLEKEFEGLNLAVTDKKIGKIEKRFLSLSRGRVKNLKQFGIDTDYSLVELTINNGEGSPAAQKIESFVANSIKRLDKTKEYPLDITKTVEEAKSDYFSYLYLQKSMLTGSLNELMEEEKKLHGYEPQIKTVEINSWMYITWLNEQEQLNIRFVSSTSYKGCWPMVLTGTNYLINKEGTILKSQDFPTKSLILRSQADLLDWLGLMR